MKPLPDLRRLAGAGAAVAVGVLAQRTLTSGSNPWDGVLLYALAAFLFVRVVRGVDPGEPSSPVGPGSRPGLRAHPLALGLLAASLILAGGSLYLFNSGPSLWSWTAFLGSLVCFVAGLAALENLPRRLGGWEEVPGLVRQWAGGLRRDRIPRREAAILLGIVGLALAVRGLGLETQPFGLFFDEAVNGLDAREVLATGKTPVYFPQNFGRGAPFIYGVAIAFRTLGESVPTLRAVAALIGVATVVAFYALGRALFRGPYLPLAGAFLLATSRWHINFSRIAFDAILVPLFLVLTLLFLWRGLRSGSLTQMGLSGIALGLGLHTYASARLVPLALGLFAAVWLIAHRDRWRRDVPGWVVLATAALLAFAPLGLYAYQETDAFLERTRSASIFNQRETTDLGQALISNTAAHVGMFNLKGDRNGRHNIPGEPMLDPLAGLFLVLGGGAAVARIRDPRYQLILVTFAVMLLGGILSLDFEAPQSLRAIGVLPPVYLLVLSAVATLAELYRSDLAPRWWQGAFVMAGLALAFVAAHNGYTYFVRQARDFASWNAFSTAQTIVAREMAALGRGVRFHVSNHFAGHPTLRFLAPDPGAVQVWREGDHVPISEGGPNGAALYLDERRESEFLRGREWYPDAEAETVRPPFGGPPILYRMVFSPGDVAGPQGLLARIFAEGADEPAISRREGPIDFDWSVDPPLSEPFLARWEGILRAPVYGAYRLGLQAPGEADLWLDGASVASGSGALVAELTLAEGLHPIAVEAQGGVGPLRLSWQRPDSDEVETVPLSALYGPPIRPEGLLGRYFSNADWEGPPTLERIDPDLSIYWQQVPLPRPYTVEWSGMLLAPSDGVYQFDTDSKDGSTLTVGGQPVVRNPGGGRVSGTATLQAGLHPISLRYADETHHTYVALAWIPPGGGPEVIPRSYLLPPRESYPPLETLLAELGIVPPPSSVPLDLDVQASWGGFDEDTPFEDPRAVAAAADGTVYVMDTALRQLGRFGPQGELLSGWSDPDWIEPADLVIDGSGNVYVVDAGLEAILVYDDGGDLQAVWGAGMGLFRPRGIGLGAAELLVADTGGARLVRISLEGAPLGEIPIPPGLEGQTAQPTDAAVDGAGRVYVSDPESQRLHVLESTGRLIRSWPSPRSDTVRATHLALGPDGAIYLTDPWGGRVLRFDPEGRLLSEVALPRSAGKEPPKPVGIAVSADGAVYVADPGSRNVWVMTPSA